MDFDDLESLRRHPAWKLLRADNAAFILGFLGAVFVEDNVRAISATELVSRLDDELYALNDKLGEGTFPKRAKAYLDDWSAPDAGWLRKYPGTCRRCLWRRCSPRAGTCSLQRDRKCLGGSSGRRHVKIGRVKDQHDSLLITWLSGRDAG